MNILIIFSLAVVLTAWTVHEHDERVQSFSDHTWEPYDSEDRKN